MLDLFPSSWYYLIPLLSLFSAPHLNKLSESLFSGGNIARNGGWWGWSAVWGLLPFHDGGFGSWGLHLGALQRVSLADGCGKRADHFGELEEEHHRVRVAGDGRWWACVDAEGGRFGWRWGSQSDRVLHSHAEIESGVDGGTQAVGGGDVYMSEIIKP